MKLRFASAALIAACTTASNRTPAPAITGDPCAVYTDATGCGEAAACTWYGTGCACPPDDPSCVCSPGVCATTGSAGPGSGSGSAGAACACPDGAVCFEQIGGPAQQQGSAPAIECATPAPGSGDPCARIEGQGTCQDSATVTGLCLCDNGER